MPLLSIIVGNYNYEKFVGRAIDSALSQTYPNIEVIVIDDGSTDGSAALLKSYQGRVRLVLKENGGATSTINAGWAEARGDIAMFLDADDLLFPEAAAEVVAAWRPEMVKVQFPLTVIDADGRPKGFVPTTTRALSAARIDRMVRQWGIYPTPPTSGNAYGRNLLAKLLPLDSGRFPQGVDGALNAVAPLYGSVVSLGVSLGAYRVHGRNLWAGQPVTPDAFKAYIEVGMQEAAFLGEHAARRGVPIDASNPLDHSLVFLERRLALLRLANDPGARSDEHPLRLFAKACRCVTVYRPTLISASASLLWFLATALAPRKLALRLLRYKYAPSDRPALLAWIARLARQ